MLAPNSRKPGRLARSLALAQERDRFVRLTGVEDPGSYLVV